LNKNRTKSNPGRSKLSVEFQPFGVHIDVSSGTCLLDASRKAKVPLNAACGGKGTCGNCVVKVIEGHVTIKPSFFLPENLREQGFVLACQTSIESNLTVLLPEFEELSLKIVSDVRSLRAQKENHIADFTLNPLVEKLPLTLPPSTLDAKYSDLKILETEIKKAMTLDAVHCEYSVLKKLARTVREKEGRVEVILFKDDPTWAILDVVPHSSHKKLLGIACDIGTTTVVLQVIDLEAGNILGTASSYNQQIRYGEDIISRINYAQKSERLQELHTAIISTINNLLDNAIKASKGDVTDIYFISLTGNTTMIHLLLGLDPRYIREEPYVPTTNRAPILRARDLRLHTNPEARVHCAPSVGSYVGGDILAGLLCTPLVSSAEKISVFVDIGTNGELVLGNKEWLMSCACSAGPAFEGGGIRCGMPAATGAIDTLKIREDGAVEYSVIGGAKPKGLCGSGLIDLLAELFVQGFVDRQGRIDPEKAADRFVKNEADKGFLVEKSTRTFWGKDLIITENDIANLIRSKGAVFSACALLFKHAGLSIDRIESFYIAGGFGQNLDVENAVRIGLFPDIERNKFQYMGNTSLLGAHLILISEKNMERVNELEKMTTYLELNTEPGYFNEYTAALFLPHTKKELFPSVERWLNR
jgi:uncharacterized 2Fe-2S/4Fe-4S cluster protein (DUF4445 family)